MFDFASPIRTNCCCSCCLGCLRACFFYSCFMLHVRLCVCVVPASVLCSDCFSRPVGLVFARVDFLLLTICCVWPLCLFAQTSHTRLPRPALVPFVISTRRIVLQLLFARVHVHMCKFVCICCRIYSYIFLILREGRTPVTDFERREDTGDHGLFTRSLRMQTSRIVGWNVKVTTK